MGDIIKGLTEVQADKTLCPPLIQELSQFTPDFYQVGQAWLPLGDAVLTTPNDFVTLTVPGDGFQD